MDSFHLWQNPWDWIVVAIASVTLTAMTVLVCNHRPFVANKAIGKYLVVNILVLSYLHWGWKLPGFPLIAVYLATAATTIATLDYTRHQKRQITAADRQTRLDLKTARLSPFWSS